MIGASGGAPSALFFAWKYPSRCEKLILISAVIEPLLYEELNAFQRFMMKRALSDRAGYRNYYRLEGKTRGNTCAYSHSPLQDGSNGIV